MNRSDLLDFQKNLSGEARSLMDKKNRDYSGGGNVLGNLTMCEELSHGDVLTEQGIILRMGDKLSRAWTLTKGDGAVVDEPMHDTCMDLINYATLLLVAHHQRRQGQVTSITLDPTPEQLAKLMNADAAQCEVGVEGTYDSHTVRPPVEQSAYDKANP